MPDWVEPVVRYILTEGLPATLRVSAISVVGSALIGVVRLADPALMVEIECMAVIPTERFKPAS